MPAYNNWLVIKRNGEQHVTPNFGRVHDLSMDCWCVPRRESSNPLIVVHFSHEPVAMFCKPKVTP